MRSDTRTTHVLLDLDGTLSDSEPGIMRSLQWACEVEGHPIEATCSIGVAMCDQDCRRIDELMKRGDLAMYDAKRAGRNTLRFFHADMELAVRQRIAGACCR